MKIDYDNGRLESKTVWFSGETDEGKKFTIMANWNSWDDWNVMPDEITFDEKNGTDEECEKIIEEFLKEMNG
jgi:hypothetical protein